MNSQIYIPFLCSVALLWAGCKSPTSSEQHQGRSARPEPTPWRVNVKKLRPLEAAKVGKLPDKPLTFLVCLAHYNKRVEETGLPSACLVDLVTAPDALLEPYPYSSWVITNAGLIKESTAFESLRLDRSRDLAPQIEQLNLRQFLWLVVRTMQMSINTGNNHLEVGYGWSAHELISPSDDSSIIQGVK